MRFTRTATAIGAMALAFGGLTACSDDEGDGRDAAETTSSAEQTAQASAVPTAEELTDILNRASDPNLPLEEKVNLVQGGDEAPELFDEIARLKTENNAQIQINGVAEGDQLGTAIGNAVIIQEGQEDINVQAQFVQIDGQWQLEKNFACGLITNAGLQAPPTCATAAPVDGAAPAEGDAGAPVEGEAPAPMEGEAPAEVPAPAEGGDVPEAPAPEVAPAPQEAPAA